MAMTRLKAMGLAVLASIAILGAGPSRAGSEARFGPAPPVDISFVQFQSPDLTKPSGTMLTIQGKLSVPGRATHPQGAAGKHGNRKLPAVLILHGSAGVDARGDFYEAALNKAGIATLQIDMWQGEQSSRVPS